VYFQCCRCGLAFSETIRGDLVEVAYRAKLLREAYSGIDKPSGQ
jgi:hypothetical protein